jgi:two-component system, OmpR family, sensor histidine kinase VicK
MAWRRRDSKKRSGGAIQSKIRYDSILDRNGPSIITSNSFVMKTYANIRRRGCRIRLITDISEANISYCKELTEYVELRHFDRIRAILG